MRAPIFYDQNDTNRFLDPNGTSQLVGTTLITRNGNSNDTFGGLEIRENNLQGAATGAATEAPGINFHWAARAAARIYMDSGGNFVIGGQSDITNNRRSLSINELFAAGEVRGTLFRDSNDTGFLIDPAGTSNINTLNGNGKQIFNTGDSYLRINEGGAFASGSWFGGSLIQGGGFYTGSNGGTTNSRIAIIGGGFDGVNAITLDGSAGTITASGNITAFSSDARLKTNVSPIANALDKVMSIGGYTFDWVDGVEELGLKPELKTHDAGVLAQEIQSVLPQAVAPAPFDWQWDEQRGENTSKSGENYLTVRYERIVPLLIEAIKEQQLTIKQQEARINNLESKLR
jgi:hypothetical protein